MEQIYANTFYKFPSNRTGLRISERMFYRVAVLSLGLLSVFLLAGIIGIGVSSVSDHLSEQEAAAQVSTLEANITKLREERDLLNASLTKMMEEKRTCPAGWTKFLCSCYLLSNESGSWTTGEGDCRDRGAGLVVIDSADEQWFLSGFTKDDAWIGLSDRNKEGTWEWIDGSPLTVTKWGWEQPNNGGRHSQLGEEDCGHIRVRYRDWNDLSCEKPLRWICEKTI